MVTRVEKTEPKIDIIKKAFKKEELIDCKKTVMGDLEMITRDYYMGRKDEMYNVCSKIASVGCRDPAGVMKFQAQLFHDSVVEVFADEQKKVAGVSVLKIEGDSLVPISRREMDVNMGARHSFENNKNPESADFALLRLLVRATCE